MTSQCASCHSPDPTRPELSQPLWDTYQEWPRVLFGSFHDSPRAGFSYEEYLTFKQRSSEVPVYRNLVFNIPDLNEYRTQRAQDNPDWLSRELIPDAEITRDLWMQSHNRHIDEATQYWNLFRLNERIQSHPHYEELKYALWVAIEHSTAEIMEDPKPGDPFFVVQALGGVRSELGREYLARYRRLLADYQKNIRHAVYSNLSINGYRGYSNSFQGANFESLEKVEIEEQARKAAELGAVLDLLGIDLVGYSTHTAGGSPLFGAHVRFKEIAFLLSDRGEMQPYDWQKGWTGFDSWIALSQEAVVSFQPAESPTPRPLSGHEILVRNCSTCHMKDEDAPYIPFAEKEEFATWLSPRREGWLIRKMTEQDAIHRMPYQYPALRPQEIQTIIDYIRTLTGSSELSSKTCQTNPFSGIETIFERAQKK